ncbi:NACHT domain-containing protein [Amycolatopsis thailandensis]|uniref:NACHT domain-containing protein n=1 Tax=Amycolatopsis thailandensis TaxID=589330 RepID=UPI00365107DB
MQTAANLAQLAALVLAVPAVVAQLSIWRRAPAPTQAAIESLATAVAAQWQSEALIRSLDDPDPIPVWWCTTARSVADHPVNTGPALKACADDIATLVKSFRELRRSRLVILGEAGTGKTTLAVQLVRELLSMRSSGEPVAVLLSVAGWDTAVHPDLRSWTAARLRQDYPALSAPEFGKDAPERLMAEGRVLPVLDGLDEMRAPARASVLEALNRSLAREDQFVVTCRTAEYEAVVRATGVVLKSALVIEPEPLSSQAVEQYLARCLPPGHAPRWRDVLDDLPITTALDLWLARIVYADRKIDPARLGQFTTAYQRRAHLLDNFIPAVIAARPPSRNGRDIFRPRRAWKPDDVRRWLTALACGMVTAGTPDFAWWRLARHAGGLTRRHGVVLGAIGGVAAVSTGTTLYGALVTVLSKSPLSFPIAVFQQLIYYLPLGIVAGATIGATLPSWARQTPGHADFKLSQAKLTERVVRWWPWAVALAVYVTDMLTLVPPRLALFFAVFVWFCAGLAAMFIALVETPTRAHGAGTPQSTLRGDRRLTTVRFWAGATLLGIGLGFGKDFSLVTFFLLGGLLAMGTGRHHAWLAYQVTLRRQRKLPRNLMAFLDDAHRLGLLRTVGPLYQFRHLALRDHLSQRSTALD